MQVKSNPLAEVVVPIVFAVYHRYHINPQISTSYVCPLFVIALLAIWGYTCTKFFFSCTQKNTPMPYDIFSIPPEIWREIMEYACTDGGYTGFSLSLSCKFFNAQCFRIRFYSLSLASTSSLEGFLQYARAHNPTGRPVVRHLHLWLMQEHPRYNDPAQATGRDWATRLADMTSEMLILVAPTLRTLCLVQGSRTPLIPIPCALPLLSELTISGSTAMLVPGVGARLPALQRLHLLPTLYERTLPSLRAALAGVPLSHLRISGLLNEAEFVPYAHALAAIAGVPLHRAPPLDTVTLGAPARPGSFPPTYPSAARASEPFRTCASSSFTPSNPISGGVASPRTGRRLWWANSGCSRTRVPGGCTCWCCRWNRNGTMCGTGCEESG